MIDLDYRKLLLSAAFHAMTCDGEVDQDAVNQWDFGEESLVEVLIVM